LSRIARAKIAASTPAGAPAVMRHGTDEAYVPGHRAMDGLVIGRIAGARLEDGSPQARDTQAQIASSRCSSDADRNTSR
jgi:hypothetical protein